MSAVYKQWRKFADKLNVVHDGEIATPQMVVHPVMCCCGCKNDASKSLHS